MTEEKSRVLEISYTGKLKESNKVFDTTQESVARQEGRYREGITYEPVVVVTGANHVIPGLDRALSEMREGEERELTIEARDGFGERDPKKVVITPLQEFRKRNINPYPGMVIEADNSYAKVQSVSGGRVRLDFNNELAGKTLLYSVKVEKEYASREEKAKALFKRAFPYAKLSGQKFEFTGGEVTIELSRDVSEKQAVQLSKKMYTEEAKAFAGIESVKFVESFSQGAREENGKPGPKKARKKSE